MCRYPPLSSHQDDITQLAGPQVALHLAEGGICVGQGGEHTLLWTCTWLHRHAWGQRGTAVRRPVPVTGRQTQAFTWTHTHTRTNRHKEKETETLSACVDTHSLLFKTKRQMCRGSHASCSVFSLCHSLTCFRVTFATGLLYVARSRQKLFNGPITRSKWPDKFSPLKREAAN